MNVGMLWYDNDPRTGLSAKIEKAADYYRRKYGQAADLCMVNPSMLESTRLDQVEAAAGRVAVRPNRVIQPDHLWIGTEDKKN